MRISDLKRRVNRARQHLVQTWTALDHVQKAIAARDEHGRGVSLEDAAALAGALTQVDISRGEVLSCLAELRRPPREVPPPATAEPAPSESVQTSALPADVAAMEGA